MVLGMTQNEESSPPGFNIPIGHAPIGTGRVTVRASLVLGGQIFTVPFFPIKRATISQGPAVAISG